MAEPGQEAAVVSSKFQSPPPAAEATPPAPAQQAAPPTPPANTEPLMTPEVARSLPIVTFDKPADPQMLSGGAVKMLQEAQIVVQQMVMEQLNQQRFELAVTGSTPKQSTEANAMKDVGRQIDKMGFAGPDDSLCVVASRGSDGMPNTRVCAAVNPTSNKGAGLIMAGRF